MSIYDSLVLPRMFHCHSIEESRQEEQLLRCELLTILNVTMARISRPSQRMSSFQSEIYF